MTKKLESVKIICASTLSESTRLKEGFEEKDFVEIRVERENPANINLVKLDSTPGKKFSRLLKQG